MIDDLDRQAENEANAIRNMRRLAIPTFPGKRTIKAKAGYRGQMVDRPQHRERLCNWRKATAA